MDVDRGRVVVVEAKARARMKTSFREIAPGVFARDIEGDAKAPAGVENTAENDIFGRRARPLRSTGESSQFGELIGTALHVATQIGDVQARVNHTLREARALFGVQLREAERAIARASRRVR